ncbi:hypothetical protein KSP40_PGU011254 [Platanthera guangdongensis]|uniref:Seipin n=1 Tax=Platanthera guangdongensis TaxID=2320717 RepID=A0ABR2MAI1_9ASPA
MESAITTNGDSSDLFFDASDDFSTPDLIETTDSSPSSLPERTGNQQENEDIATSRRKVSSTSLRRRRASFRSTVPIYSPDANDLSCDSGETSTSSTLTSLENVSGRDCGQETSSDEPRPLINESPSQRFLVSLADLVVKSILFQINLLIKCLTLPTWLTYSSLLFVANPLGTLRSTVDGMKMKILWFCKVAMDSFRPFVPEMLRKHHGIGKLAGRMACGCFWSLYVGTVLSGLLLMAFFSASLLISRIAEEPLKMSRSLNFDYTKASPDALVPLMPCDGAECSFKFDKQVGFSKPAARRLIPRNHKLHLIISLTLPESDYNRNLGIFQVFYTPVELYVIYFDAITLYVVRAEFLSINGEVISGVSKPCMLRFKSPPIRLMETFIKSGPLLAGYSSESQVINMAVSGFTEGPEPTMCLRIVLEQRAEYRPGAGIPEIYTASLKLESELPILKKMIWNWRRTLLVWSAMGFFIWETLIVLVFFRPLLFPRIRWARVASVGN